MKIKISVEDFKNFLENPKNNVKGSKELFMKYFDNNIAFEIEEETFDNLIRKDEKYAITFVEDIERSDWKRYGTAIVGGATGGAAICLLVPGVGWAATPACLVLGSVANTIKFLAEDAANGFHNWYNDSPNKDAMMFSKYDSKGYCGGGYLS